MAWRGGAAQEGGAVDLLQATQGAVMVAPVGEDRVVQASGDDDGGDLVTGLALVPGENDDPSLRPPPGGGHMLHEISHPAVGLGGGAVVHVVDHVRARPHERGGGSRGQVRSQRPEWDHPPALRLAPPYRAVVDERVVIDVVVV